MERQSTEQVLISTVCNGDNAAKFPGIRVVSVAFLEDLYELQQGREVVL